MFSIKKVKNSILNGLAIAHVSIVSAMAAGGGSNDSFTQMNDSGAEAQTTVANVLQSWKWVLAFLPFALAIALALMVKTRLDEKEENGQYEPKLSKYAKIVGASVLGMVIAYILYGALWKVFINGNDSFSQGWSTWVTEFWAQALG